jgi:iron complex outermembrane receptor protein
MHSYFARWSKAISLFVCVAVMSATAWSQSASGTIKGTISDASGKILVGASTTLSDTLGIPVQRGLTDMQGFYAFANLPSGRYELSVSATGFRTIERIVNVEQSEQTIDLKLVLASIAEQVVVEADDNSSIAVQNSPVKALLDETSPHTEISSVYIREFTSPMTDFSDITQAAPGTMSFSVNGIGNGQAKTWYRGFKDGMYTMTWDGVPFQDSNDPTHHSWAYVPAPAISYVDFDRSPGNASDVGPANFGGSIHMFSPKLSNARQIRGSVSYGSFNSTQVLGQFNSGLFWNNKANFWFEGHHQNSDGYQTNNFQQRTAATAKFVLKLTDKTDFALVGTSVIVDSNTPNSDATRRQLFHNGDNYLMDANRYYTNSSGAQTDNPQYYKFYNYHVPTNFEVATIDSDLGHGWTVNSKTYTYSYSNHQHYQNGQDQDLNTTPLPANIFDGGKGSNGKTLSTVTEAVTSKSGINKLNQYNRIGEIATFAAASRYGVLRFGSWAEWTNTNRYQVASDPRTWLDSFTADKTYPTVNADLKFHEKFWTDSLQPYLEYQYVGIPKLTVTAGIKSAFYRMTLQQFADGKTVGNLGGNAFVNHRATYNSWLPSVAANYRLRKNWSAYGQYGRGSVIPPSSVFDATGAQVATLPKPTIADTVQGGSVFRINRLSLDADVFHIHFQNNYTSYNDSTTGLTYYYSAAPSNTFGLEGEGNIAVTHALSFVLNGTAGQAKYEAANAYTTPTGSAFAATPSYWVSNAAHDTESAGLTYQTRGINFGFFNKRIGTRYDAAGNYADSNKVTYGSGQNIAYDPFWMSNLFVNYTIRKNSFFDGSKIKLSINNLMDNHDMISISSAAIKQAPLTPYTPSANDQLNLLAGRSVMVTFQIGLSPHHQN